LWSPLDSSIGNTAILSAITGSIIHLATLRPFEVEYFMYKMLGLLSVATGLLMAAYPLAGFTITQTVIRVAIVAVSFNAGLFTSMVIYRVFFHRLRRFPGPVGAKVTRFWSAWITSREVKYHKEVARMHEQYGDFVRTGKYTISCA
jgi:hypothetical protein